MGTPASASSVGEALKALRVSIGWSQRELAARAGVSQAWVSLVERGRLDGLPLASAERVLGAMGARLIVSVDRPFLGDRLRQREPAHARCSTHVAMRLRRAGWSVATEVEIGGDRSRGWIDVLAWHPVTGWLMVIEIKTEIHDLGAIERSLGWYEREAWRAARRRGWRPRAIVGCLLLLATEVNDVRVQANRQPLAEGFSLRAAELRGVVDGTAETAGPGPALGRPVRGLAMIDPMSRRALWLRPLRIDGRRSPAPYADYADFMDGLQRGRRIVRRAGTPARTRP